MYCTKCGAKLEPNERFCPHCGEMVEDAFEPPSAPPPSPSPAPQSPPVQPPASNSGKKPGGKKPVIIGAVIAAVLLALILAAVFLLGGKDKPNDAASSPSPDQSFDPSEEPTDTDNTSPSQPLETEEPSAGPSEAPSTDAPPSQPPETAAPATVPASLPDLYIGAWVAEGDTIEDDTNGWQAFYLESVNGNTLTFTLESVGAAPYNRIADTYPITVAMENGKGTFPVNDSWGNSGMGEITLKGDAIHVTVDITAPDPMAMWDIGMDEDFYPANSASNQQGQPVQPTQITVMADGSELSLSQTPYLDNGEVMIPMEQVFEAVGITVFQDNDTIALTESHAITLMDMGGEYILNVDGLGTDWDRSALVSYSNGCYYVPLNILDVFGLQTSWDSAGKVATIQGTIASADRVSAQKVEALKQFDKDAAAQRVLNAGYSFAPSGSDCGYWGGCKYWSIPVTTADGIQDVVTTYDGKYYEMNVYPREYID